MTEQALSAPAPRLRALASEAGRIARFGAVGLVNTAIGAGTIAIGLHCGLGDYAANAAGYGLGLVSSYILNRRFTFRAKGSADGREKLRFAMTAGISYLVNLTILLLGRRIGAGGTMALQLVAMAAYTMTFYALSRLFVFSANERPSRDRAARRGDPLALADSNLLVLALVLATAVPILFPPILPLMDLGGHVGRYAVQIDGGRSADLARWYGFQWGLLPNLGVDLLVQGLAPLIGLEPAVHLIVGAIPPLMVLGLLLLAREAHGRIPPGAAFAAPLAYGAPYIMGFANFTLGIAMATLLLALWMRLGRSHPRFRAALFVPLGFILWLCHLVAYGVFGIVAGCIELDRQRARGRGWTASILHAGLALIPLLSGPLAGRLFPHRADPGEPFRYLETSAKLAYPLLILRDTWSLWDTACATVVVLAAFVALRAQGWHRHRGLVGAGLVLTALYVVMPDVIMGSHYADIRLLPIILGLLIIAGAPPTETAIDRRRAGLILAAALGFAGVRMASTTYTLLVQGRQAERSLSALDALPRGSNLITLYVAQCGGWSSDRRHHLGGYALARHHAFDNAQWEMPSGQLLSVHNPDAQPFVRDPSEVTFLHPCHGAADLATTIAAVPTPISWLWVIENGQDNDFGLRDFPGWQPVRQSGNSVLLHRRAEPLGKDGK